MPILGVLSANLTLLGYGRFARHPTTMRIDPAESPANTPRSYLCYRVRLISSCYALPLSKCCLPAAASATPAASFLPVIRPERRILFVNRIGSHVNYMGSHRLRQFSIPSVFCIHFCEVAPGSVSREYGIDASLLLRLRSNTANRSVCGVGRSFISCPISNTKSPLGS